MFAGDQATCLQDGRPSTKKKYQKNSLNKRPKQDFSSITSLIIVALILKVVYSSNIEWLHVHNLKKNICFPFWVIAHQNQAAIHLFLSQQNSLAASAYQQPCYHTTHDEIFTVDL